MRDFKTILIGAAMFIALIFLVIGFGAKDTEARVSNDDLHRMVIAEERQAKALEQILQELRKIRQGR